MSVPDKQAQDGKNHQLPSSVIAPEFGEVDVKRNGDAVEVLFTILMEPTGSAGEGWQTGVAIDASGSMEGVYGKALLDGRAGPPPRDLLDEYRSRGWLSFQEHKGKRYPVLTQDAKMDLVERGHFRWSENQIEPLAQKMTAYLADNLDADGGTTVIYWACGNGRQIEVLGDLTAQDCERASFAGPQKVALGSGTCLKPAVEYFVQRFADAKSGMYIFITDGELHDLEEVKQYTISLCRDIEAKRRNPVKCVLIGLGDNIHEDQMEQLDDLDSGTSVDIWDHKIARDMRSLVDIFSEVVNENQVVAPTARICDASGNVVKNYSDGLPAKVRFEMPASSDYFELEVAGRRIRQTVLFP